MGWGQSKQTHEFPGGTCTFLILGKTGSGKSSTGNMLLGKKRFLAKGSLDGTTEKFQRSDARFSNLKLQVIDTPGFFHPTKGEKWASAIIGRGLVNLDPAPNIILFTISCRNKFTEEEKKAFDLIKYLVGPDASTYMIIVFTGIDEMTEVIEKDLAKRGNSATQKMVAEVVQYAGSRYVTFNNRLPYNSEARDNQIHALLQIAKKIVAVNPRIKQCSMMVEKANELIQQYMSEESARVASSERSEVGVGSEEDIRKEMNEASLVEDI